MPGLIDKTVRNLREVQPTMLFNVPLGFDMLLPFLEADDRLAADVLARMRLAFYAAAALAPGGVLILSGLLNTQEAMVLAAHRAVGLYLKRRIRRGKWSVLVLGRE